MKLTAPYKCDYCDRTKAETNHWWLREVRSSLFLLQPWTPAQADLEGMEHICSEQCAVKALSKWMATTPQREAR